MITYPLIQYGSGPGVYATDDNTNTGMRYIAEVDGLEVFALTDNVGTQRALDRTIYSQYQPVKDELVVVRFPRSDIAKWDAIRDVIQAAVTGLTTFTLNITTDEKAFTFTAKPAEEPIKYRIVNLPNKFEVVEFRQYCTD